MNHKTKLFSVTSKDFEMQTFTVGGHGGGGKDTSNSGVRLVHKASGARGEGRDHRSNTRNRRDAFLRLVETNEFKRWLKIEIARHLGQRPPETKEQILARVDQMIEDGLKNGTIRVEEIGNESDRD